ncbi:MAG: hypothetical protein ACRYFU_15050 [Janthinobacterium lividum]
MKRTGLALTGIAKACLGLMTLAAVAPAQDISAAARRADFKTFVQDFQNHYAYADRAEKPWLTWEARYREAVGVVILIN